MYIYIYTFRCWVRRFYSPHQIFMVSSRETPNTQTWIQIPGFL